MSRRRKTPLPSLDDDELLVRRPAGFMPLLAPMNSPVASAASPYFFIRSSASPNALPPTPLPPATTRSPR